MRSTILVALAACIVILGGGGILLSLDEDGTPQVRIIRAPSVPQGDTEQSRPLPTGNPAESSLRDEAPAVPGVETRAVKPGEKVVPGPKLPTGGAQNYSCRRDFSGHVYSSRNGAKPRLLVLHYTVSPNVKGWGDVLGVQGYFKRSRVGSSTFIVDFEGNCVQMVPIAEKPWTQGAANPVSISWEIIATGRETTAQWLASPLIKDGILAEMVRDQGRANGIPLVFRDPVGCNFPAGYTDHNHIDCGNNHTDVAPAFPFARFNAQLADAPGEYPAKELARCRRLNKYRAWVRSGTHPSAGARAAAKSRKAILARRGYRCGRSGLRKV